MNKLEIKKHLIDQIAAEVAEIEHNYADYLSGSGLASDQSISLGEESQLVSNAEFSNKLHAQSDVHKKNLEFLKGISFEPSSVVELGAIVETKNIFLIVATSTKPFKYDNKKFVAISLDAPLYQCLKGKAVGDECTHNNVKFVIKNIF